MHLEMDPTEVLRLKLDSQAEESELFTKSVGELTGVGEKLKTSLAKLGIYSLRDCLFHFPFRYEDRSQQTLITDLTLEQEAVVIARVSNCYQQRLGSRKLIICELSDDSGKSLALKFFHFSRAQAKQFYPNRLIQCYGKIQGYYNSPEMIHPEYQFLYDDTFFKAEYRPVYHLAAGLSQNKMYQIIEQALQLLESTSIVECLSNTLIKQTKLPDFKQALLQIHRPNTEQSLESLQQLNSPFHQRLIVEELFAYQAQIYLHKRNQQQQLAIFQIEEKPSSMSQKLLNALPFALTQSQAQAIKEIEQDLQQNRAMQRLVQGDVGSGKTIVAAFAMLHAVEQSFQACFMAPTTLLSEQHYQSLSQLLEPLNVRVACINRQLSSSEKNKLLAKIANAEINIVVGTHALIQESVNFSNLAMVVVDEQHRFGVQQRLQLFEKSFSTKASATKLFPHYLLMSATPIPRTLISSIYGDIAYSIIDQLPAGRKPIETRVLSQSHRGKLIERIRAVCAKGQQAYWVCGLISESDKLQCQAAEVIFQELSAQITEFKLALIHGQMSSEQKQTIMQDFIDNKIRLLVSTTVIEVGVNVANACYMVIENAERMGLAQLHQLRGRVGRSEQQSYCILLFDDKLSQQSKKRLNIIRNSQNGFEIAEQDLRLRGQGERMGTLQSGNCRFFIVEFTDYETWFPVIREYIESSSDEEQQKWSHLITRWQRHEQQMIAI